MANILVAEDDGSVRRMIKRVLEMKNNDETIAYEVVEAGNAEQALMHLHADGEFHLGITDYNMGMGKNGVELIHEAHTIPGRENLPYIVLSSVDPHDNIELRTLLEEVPQVYYLGKPISNITMLMDLVEKALAGE